MIVILSYSISEYLTSLIIYIDGFANTTALPSGTTLTALKNGPHNITIVTVDLSNNVGKANVIFNVDTTSPFIIIDTPNPTLHTTNTISINLGGDAVNYWYYIAGVDGDNQTWTSTTQRSLEDETYTLYAYGNDSVGNEAYRKVIFTLDTSSPTITHPEEVLYEEGTTGHAITWSSSDATPASFRITRDGAFVLVSCCWYGEPISINVDGLPVGNYTFVCTVLDQAGYSGSDSVIVSVRKKPSQAPWPPLVLSLGAIGLVIVLRQSMRKSQR